MLLGNPGFPSVKFDVNRQANFKNGGYDIFTVRYGNFVENSNVISVEAHAGMIYESFNNVDPSKCNGSPTTTTLGTSGNGGSTTEMGTSGGSTTGNFI